LVDIPIVHLPSKSVVQLRVTSQRAQSLLRRPAPGMRSGRPDWEAIEWPMQLREGIPPKEDTRTCREQSNRLQSWKDTKLEPGLTKPRVQETREAYRPFASSSTKVIGQNTLVLL